MCAQRPLARTAARGGLTLAGCGARIRAEMSVVPLEIGAGSAAARAGGKLRWRELYSEAELYKAAVRLYTKPLFAWRKALSTSTDSRNLYDFARDGLRRLEGIHRALSEQEFHFRPGLALHRNFNGKKRTIYIYPWEERLVDLLLYRLLCSRLHHWFSPHAYAYRWRGFGVDRCQRRIAARLKSAAGPVYVLKRDIAEYFPSVDHEILLEQLAGIVDPGDSLYSLLRERVRFAFMEEGAQRRAARGIPFGTAIACLFANVHLTGLDRRVAGIPGVTYFRYADDVLALSEHRGAAQEAAAVLETGIRALNLRSKLSHELNLVFAARPIGDADFSWAGRFRHLGLEFRAGGPTGLSRDKFRKLCNLFRFAFRRQRAKFGRTKDPLKRAQLAVEIARKTVSDGVRNVAILDYYLKHVEDEEQLRRLDRWLAEEALALAFGRHRRGNFRKLPYARLREMGLPSLVHRRRLIEHGRVESPFFIWKTNQREKSSRGMAARRRSGPAGPAAAAFSPCPAAAVEKAS